MGNWISPSCTVASLWVYHFSKNRVYPSGCCVCVSNFGRKECLRCWVSYVCVCVSVSIFGVCKAEKCLSVSVTDFCVCWVCVSVCTFLSLCVCPCVCISVSDRCVGSGLQSCWHRGLALLCLVGRSGRRHNRSAGTAPGRGYLSCGGGYTPGPPSAQAYRCETRSAWHNTDPRSSLQISNRYPLPDLKRVMKMCQSAKQTSLKTSCVIIWI